LGFKIPKQQHIVAQAARASMYGCLLQVRQNGFKPRTVIDVGAAQGTPVLYDVFPQARYILIEPLEEYIPHLKQLVDRLDIAEYIIAAATATPGNVVINVHPDLEGSSLYQEDEDSDVNGVERTIPAMTLDNICSERDTKGPYIIKIDTQGSELEVLKGAQTILKDTEFVILEVSFFEFFKGGPQVYDCLSFMNNLGFVPYDIFDLQYRLLDGAMSQVDIAFVPEQSQLRKYHFYATREQRSKLTQQLLS
jgi:FkbM family methyltransferase